MKKITITFAPVDKDGWVKATVCEGTNNYLFTCYGVTEADAIMSAAHGVNDISYSQTLTGVNLSLERRG